MTKNQLDNTKVWNAAHSGNIQRLKYLLSKEGLKESIVGKISDEQAKNKQLPKILVKLPRYCDGSTPVFAAAAGGHGSCMELLLTYGADINVARHDGATPFYIACLMGHLAVVKLIYQIKGADAFRDTTLDDWTPLLAAVQRGHQEVVVFLVDTHRKAFPLKEHTQYLKRRTVRGYDAFQLAKRRGQTAIAAYMEWSVGVPGTGSAPGGRLSGDQRKKPSTDSDCGLQAFVQNKGKWGYDADRLGFEPVPIREYGFDTTVPKSFPKSDEDYWTSFVRKEKRNPGGCATTLNVFECLGMEFDDCAEEIPVKALTGKFDRANLKMGEAHQLMQTKRFEEASRSFISAAVLFSTTATIHLGGRGGGGFTVGDNGHGKGTHPFGGQDRQTFLTKTPQVTPKHNENFRPLSATAATQGREKKSYGWSEGMFDHQEHAMKQSSTAQGYHPLSSPKTGVLSPGRNSTGCATPSDTHQARKLSKDFSVMSSQQGRYSCDTLKSPYERSLEMAKHEAVNKQEKKNADAQQRVCRKMAEHCRRAHELESKGYQDKKIEDLLISAL